MAKVQQDLYLQVSASVDPFTRALKAGKAGLLDFAGDVDKNLAAIQQSFQQLGGAEGDVSARALEKSYSRTFASLRRQAEDLNLGQGGSISLDVEGARAAAAAAENRALGLGEIAAAAARAAVAVEGASAAERVYALAATAAATGAEEEAAALRLQAASLERVQAELNAAGVSSVRFAGHQASVVTSSGAMRAGMQQLGFQLNDVATSFQGGISPMTIFAQQGSQVVQAIQLMAGESKGFIGFLAGPWGAVLTASAVVVGSLVSKLFDTKDAAKEAADAMADFARRQSDIGNFIDATTGRLIEQNRQLRESAILSRAAEIGKNAGKVGEATRKAFDAASAGAVRGREFAAERQPSRAIIDPDVAKAIADANGDANKLTDSLYRLATGPRRDLAGLAKSVAEAGGAAVLAARDNKRLQDEIDQLTGRTRGAVSSTSALVERQVANATATTALARAQAHLNDVRARGSVIDKMEAGAAKDRALAAFGSDLTSATLAVQAAEKSRAAGALATRERETAAKREASDQAKRVAEMAKFREEANGKLNELDTAKVYDSPQLTADKQARHVFADVLGIDVDGDLAKFRDDMARTRDAALDSFEEGRRNSPLAGYTDELRRSVGDVKIAMEGLKVDAFHGLEEGLVGVISGTETVGQAFKRMATSIIADLARIEIERTILGTIDSVGGGGIFGAIGSLLTGKRAAGGAVDRGGLYLVGEKGPELFAPGTTGTVIPNNALRSVGTSGAAAMSAGARAGPTINFDARGAVMTRDLLGQMQQIAAQTGGQVYTASVAHTNDSLRDLARQRL